MRKTIYFFALIFVYSFFIFFITYVDIWSQFQIQQQKSVLRKLQVLAMKLLLSNY